MRTVRTGPVIGLLAQLALLTLLAGTAGLGVAGWLAGTGCGVVTYVLLSRGLTRAGMARLGPANRVTLTRAVLVGAVAALVAGSFTRPLPVWTLVALAAVALLLDGVDGRVARYTHTASPLGARFDMEVDAFLIFVLSVCAAPVVGPWVLAIGAFRYAYVVAGWLLPWLRQPAPFRYWCKVVAAIQGVVLTFVVAGVAPHWLTLAASIVALALLTESFGREAWWLWRHRPLPGRVVLPVRQLVTGGVNGRAAR